MGCWRLMYTVFRRDMTYRFDWFAGMFSTFLTAWIAILLWQILVHRAHYDEIEGHRLLSYIAMASLFRSLFSGTIQDYVQSEILTGRVAIDLLKPIHYPTLLVFHSLGEATSKILQIIPVFFSLLLFTPLTWPSSLLHGIFAVSSLFLGMLVYILLDIAIGLTAFWTTDLTGTRMMKQAIFFLFSGVFVPLWYFPKPLLFIANILPFKAMIYVPAYVYSSQNRPSTDTLWLQLFWIMVLWIAVISLWNRAQNKLVIYGG